MNAQGRYTGWRLLLGWGIAVGFSCSAWAALIWGLHRLYQLIF